MPASLELAGVPRILKAKPAAAGIAVVASVAIEVDDVIRLAGATGAAELRA
jgi:hypothetical protein